MPVTGDLCACTSARKLSLILAAQRLSLCAKVHILFLKESHSAPLFSDFEQESNNTGYLVSQTNDFRNIFMVEHGLDMERILFSRISLSFPELH